ncbi:phosphatidylinositol-3,4,5-trisphosphate binding [Bonamia ostreae]|uniref:Phosphatidylinositol-3,4,5-trisphosphate binding n=1 Tax=Bonamia ostreae TaxID=126728 RepID=A0ABV2ALL4_9EUKA
MSTARRSIFEQESSISIEITKSDLAKRTFHQSWLVKRGGFKSGIKHWKKRFFVLKEDYLYYFKNLEAEKPLGKFSTKHLSTTLIGEKKESRNFAFVTYERTIYARAYSVQERNKWCDAVKSLQQKILENSRERALSTEKLVVEIKDLKKAIPPSSPTPPEMTSKNNTEMNTLNTILSDEIVLRSSNSLGHKAFQVVPRHGVQPRAARLLAGSARVYPRSGRAREEQFSEGGAETSHRLLDSHLRQIRLRRPGHNRFRPNSRSTSGKICANRC